MSSLSPSESSELSLYSFTVIANPGYSLPMKNFTPKKYLMRFVIDSADEGTRMRVVAWPNQWEPVAYE